MGFGTCLPCLNRFFSDPQHTRKNDLREAKVVSERLDFLGCPFGCRIRQQWIFLCMAEDFPSHNLQLSREFDG